MKYTMRMAAAIVAVILAASLAGCHTGAGDGAVSVKGANGKVYSGTANQVSSQMGQDYAAGLRNMAAQAAMRQQ